MLIDSRRSRQAGRGAGRAEGALRRAEQHRVGDAARSRRHPRGLRRREPEDALQAVSGGPPARRTACAATPISAPATTTAPPRRSTPISACSPPIPASSTTCPRSSTTSPATRSATTTSSCWWRRSTCAARFRALIDREASLARAGSPGADHHQVQRGHRSGDRSARCIRRRRTAWTST